MYYVGFAFFFVAVLFLFFCLSRNNSLFCAQAALRTVDARNGDGGGGSGGSCSEPWRTLVEGGRTSRSPPNDVAL